MRIGVVEGSWWKGACEALGHEVVTLPKPAHPSGNAHASDLAARIANGSAIAGIAADERADLILDNSGAGLAFLPGAGAGGGELTLAHAAVHKPLLSHFIDPIVTAFQGLDWVTTWQCLQDANWVKAVWDRAAVRELRDFGIPSVVQLPMAAPDRYYETAPLDPAKLRPAVSFVGAQNSSFFAGNAQAPTSGLLAGVLAHAVRGDSHNATFYDVYHQLYGLGTPVVPDDPPDVRLQKMSAYFNAKLFYNATMNIRNRDRFVLFLHRHFRNQFELVGARWDSVYGLPTRPPLPTNDAYFNNFREVAINLNLVNGNAETGLNMRHFEITAAGGFMLCYDQPELSEWFDVGTECAVFTSENDLVEKVQYYLARPDERVAIALAGQRRTLSEHLYSHRLEMLLSMVKIHRLPVDYASTNWTDDLKSVVPNPDIVLDCGANIGQMAEGLRNLYPKADIYSFEPVDEAFAKLQAKCAELHVHPVKKAVSDQNGKATIHITQSREACSLLGFQEGNPCERWTQVVGAEEVEVCTIDQWCRDSGIDPGRVDVIKMDVQGAELKALQGASRVLKTAKAVYAEVSFVPIYKDTPLLGDIDSFMGQHGFRRHAIYPSDQPQNWGDALYVKAQKGEA